LALGCEVGDRAGGDGLEAERDRAAGGGGADQYGDRDVAVCRVTDQRPGCRGTSGCDQADQDGCLKGQAKENESHGPRRDRRQNKRPEMPCPFTISDLSAGDNVPHLAIKFLDLVLTPGGWPRRAGGNSHQTRTLGLISSKRREPMPVPSRSWSTLVKPPCVVRQSMMREASTSPTPGSCSSWSWVAVLRSRTASAGFAAEPGAAAGAPTMICSPSTRRLAR